MKKEQKYAFPNIMTVFNFDVMACEHVLDHAMQACTLWSFIKMIFTWKCTCQGSLTAF